MNTAPDYSQDLALSEQTFNEADVLAYGAFEQSEMSESDKNLARTQYIATMALISQAIEDFYSVRSIGEKLDDANAMAETINAPGLKARALHLVKLVSNIVSSGNANNQLDSIRNFIQVESVYHEALCTGLSPYDAAKKNC